MTDDGTYAIKLGDSGPPLLCTLLGADLLPADLSEVSELKIAVRDAGEEEFKLERDAEIVDPSNQAVEDETRGKVRVEWTSEETIALGVGDKEAEFQAIRDGKRVSWPSAGYVPFTIWPDIVPDESS